MSARGLPELHVHVERERHQLKVVACSTGEPPILIEAVYSGGAEGMWFRLTKQAETRTFDRQAVARHPALSAILRLIADEVDTARAGRSPLLGLLFKSLLVYEARMSSPVPLPRWGRPILDPRIERAVEMLNTDISKRWTVDLLARSVGLSRPTFARLFIRILGLSPMRYLTQRRMQVAATLLLTTNATLSDVAGRVGFQSEFAFSRSFKRHHGVPPGQYRTRSPSSLRPICRAA